jgi:hypothetical protein
MATACTSALSVLEELPTAQDLFYTSAKVTQMLTVGHHCSVGQLCPLYFNVFKIFSATQHIKLASCY